MRILLYNKVFVTSNTFTVLPCVLIFDPSTDFSLCLLEGELCPWKETPIYISIAPSLLYSSDIIAP